MLQSLGFGAEGLGLAAQDVRAVFHLAKDRPDHASQRLFQIIHDIFNGLVVILNTKLLP